MGQEHLVNVAEGVGWMIRTQAPESWRGVWCGYYHRLLVRFATGGPDRALGATDRDCGNLSLQIVGGRDVSAES